MKEHSAYSTGLCWNGTEMFEVVFFVMEFPLPSLFPDLVKLVKEPQEHKNAAWRPVKQVIKGLEEVPAYQMVVWEGLLKITVLKP